MDNLPPEILLNILKWLPPGEFFKMSRVNCLFKNLVAYIAKDKIKHLTIYGMYNEALKSKSVPMMLFILQYPIPEKLISEIFNFAVTYGSSKILQHLPQKYLNYPTHVQYYKMILFPEMLQYLYPVPFLDVYQKIYNSETLDIKSLISRFQKDQYDLRRVFTLVKFATNLNRPDLVFEICQITNPLQSDFIEQDDLLISLDLIPCSELANHLQPYLNRNLIFRNHSNPIEFVNQLNVIRTFLDNFYFFGDFEIRVRFSESKSDLLQYLTNSIVLYPPTYQSDENPIRKFNRKIASDQWNKILDIYLEYSEEIIKWLIRVDDLEFYKLLVQTKGFKPLGMVPLFISVEFEHFYEKHL